MSKAAGRHPAARDDPRTHATLRRQEPRTPPPPSRWRGRMRVDAPEGDGLYEAPRRALHASPPVTPLTRREEVRDASHDPLARHHARPVGLVERQLPAAGRLAGVLHSALPGAAG